MGIADHSPSEEVLKRARGEGIDLEELRSTDPQKYRIINSVPLAVVDVEYLEQIAEELHKAFPETEIFQIPGKYPKVVRLFSFPLVDVAKLDSVLASIAGQHGDLFFRIIQDVRGERRELQRAIDPSEWQGIEGLVGPFSEEHAAEEWGSKSSQSTGLESDVFQLRGTWFCEVFDLSET